MKQRQSESSMQIERPAGIDTVLEEATAMREEGRIDEAVSTVETAMEAYPACPELMNLKAELYLQLGRVEEAGVILLDAFYRFPFDLRSLNNIAVIEILQKRYDSALGLLKRVLDINPEDSVALSNLQFVEVCLLVRSKLAEAEQCITKGEFKSARRTLDEVIAVQPHNGKALANLAVVEVHEGKNNEAVRILQRIVAENPGSQFAAALMDKILLG